MDMVLFFMFLLIAFAFTCGKPTTGVMLESTWEYRGKSGKKEN